MTFGEKIRYLRQKKKISQKEFAILLGMHKNHIGRYEKEQSAPTSPVLKKICEILDVSADYLLFDRDEKNNTFDIKDQELLEKFKLIDKFNDEDKKLIKELIDVFITQDEMKKILNR